MALSKNFKRTNLAQNVFELHAWVKKCHFGKFSERAEMSSPQNVVVGIEKLILIWVPMNI